MHTVLTSFEGLTHLQFLIASSMRKRREKAWGFVHDLWHRCHIWSHVVPYKDVSHVHFDGAYTIRAHAGLVIEPALVLFLPSYCTRG